MACLQEFTDANNAIADVVAYPIHPDAPFQFVSTEKIRVIDRNGLVQANLNNMISANQYDLIICGGWRDKLYLGALAHRNGSPAALAFDNQWVGSAKQWLAILWSRYAFLPLFDWAFVPGVEQKKFAEKMGFKKIEIGFYAGDFRIFNQVKEERLKRDKLQSTKNLIFVGRYAQEKQIALFSQVFCAICDEFDLDWKLICVGTGPEWNDRIRHRSIQHLGFLQPDELRKIMLDGDAFVLPSSFEPWGVVVHEFAMAGFALLLSDKVGAATAFLKNDWNGYVFQSQSKESMKKAILQLMNTTQEKLHEMGANSASIAAKISPKTWSESVLKMIHERK
jgi:glycosyltransferase involved in cell wall biosynthesis